MQNDCAQRTQLCLSSRLLVVVFFQKGAHLYSYNIPIENEKFSLKYPFTFYRLLSTNRPLLFLWRKIFRLLKILD